SSSACFCALGSPAIFGAPLFGFPIRYAKPARHIHRDREGRVTEQVLVIGWMGACLFAGL
ncbi:hypothetical protein, partial [Mesorhizobium humile]|uniref:hypothetical protein n=1 Tax=Mesorhizobium humile TaxID=3072313 RepID=UPI002A23FB1B